MPKRCLRRYLKVSPAMRHMMAGRSYARSRAPQKISVFYRARAFQSSALLEEALRRPDIGLGSPPSHLAIAGRMNARGISVFYGALDANVAVAEIRPPVGSRVMVGEFNIARPLKLLDVEALQSVFVKGSIFDGGHIHQLEHAKFLGHLSRRITMPVMPDDEPTDYLMTQAIADYLATELSLTVSSIDQHRPAVRRKTSCCSTMPPG